MLERLRGEIEGDLFLDLPRRLLYSTSASSNSVLPEGVVRPKSAADVAAAVAFCREEGIPVIPRGAATGMAGGNLGRGVVIDFVRHLRRIEEVDSSGCRVRVQPGALYGALNRALEPHRLFLPPDPSSGAYCTLGGMVANNAAGAHSVKYGPTRDYVLALEGVGAGGEFARFEPLRANGSLSLGPGAAGLGPVLEKAYRLLRANRGVIEKGYPAVTKNSSGYLLQGALRDGVFDVPKLLCGSEGSLALFTAIELRVVPQPPRRGLVFAAFETLEEAGKAVLAARALGPSALEILDRSLIQAILKTRLPLKDRLPEGSEAALLVEWEGGDDAEVGRGLARVREALEPTALSAVEAREDREQRKLWDLRRGAAVKARREDWKKPVRVIEDAAVPPERVADYIRGVREILRKHGAEAILVGHAGNGNIHVEPLLDVRSPGLKETIQSLASEVSALVRSLGGTLSGEHGDGIVRSPYLPKIYPELYPVFEELKRVFDPQGILNPGVILPFPRARSLVEELRYGFEPVKTGTVFDELHLEVERCFSCGVCRNYCPAYADSGEEESLPRARAALLRGLVAGIVSPGELFASKEARNVFELCFNCGRCAPECPAGFDSARLSTLAKGYFEEKRPTPPAERLLTTPEAMGRSLHRAPRIVLDLLDASPLRRVGAPLCGIASEREIPKLPEKTLTEMLRLRSFPKGERGTVVYFPGCYAEFHDPMGEGVGTILCLEANGFRVEVPDLECCGIAQLTTSGFARARGGAERNVDRLLAYVRLGWTVILSSPSCGHAVTEEYPYFLQTEESRKVSRGSRDACRFLADLLEKGALEPPGELRLRVAYHNPCHLRVRGLGPEAIALLRAIPGLELAEMPDRCCGMAGTFGAKERHYERSMAIAAPQVESVRGAEVQAVATGCGTCQIQMEHGADLPAVHPLALLAAGYGHSECLPETLREAGHPTSTSEGGSRGRGRR